MSVDKNKQKARKLVFYDFWLRKFSQMGLPVELLGQRKANYHHYLGLA